MAAQERGSLEIETASLSLDVNMVGISLAIFTFLLFFDFTTSASKNAILAQATLVVNTGAVFSFALAGLYNFVLLYSRPANHPQTERHVLLATIFFSVGVQALLLEPALVLFAVGLSVPAVVALILFGCYVPIYAMESRTIRGIVANRSPPPRL